MTIARTLAVALRGVSGHLIEVEADLSSGLPGMSFTGLADASVVEARDRIRAALLNSGAAWPNRRITVALLPADMRKVGSHFDLAIAVTVLATASEVPADSIVDIVWVAELGLDGRLRPVRGVLPAALAAQRAGVPRAIVASANQAEAALVGGIDVRSATDLTQVLGWLRGELPMPPAARPATAGSTQPSAVDLSDIAGQGTAKRALEIAAAGGHHLQLVGSPGTGKTMLAERLPGLLPPLDEAAALEVTALYSVAGVLPPQAQLVRQPPFQAPHHTATVAALVGGGTGLASPGAISLAHHGVLFLDEAPEFQPTALDAMRQPLESGRVVLHRGQGVVTYPAQFLLVLAANPCPCASRPADCICPPHVRRRYQHRLSGPLLDRIDLRVVVHPVPSAQLLDDTAERERTSTVAARVAQSRAIAVERWRRFGWRTNREATGAALRRPPWRLPASVLAPAASYLERGELTARGFDRVLRLAWTISDLAGQDSPRSADVAEAVHLRSGRPDAWAA